ncbi:MAG: ATP-binding protein [Thermodesulfobacteriota bacterium]
MAEQEREQLRQEVSSLKAEVARLKSAEKKHIAAIAKRTEELTGLNNSLAQKIKNQQEDENSLRWAKEQAELLYQLSPCAIFTVDKNKVITSWNKKVEEITGYSFDEIRGRRCDIFCSEPCLLFEEYIPKPLLNKRCSLTARDGSRIIISKSADLLTDPENNVIGGIESFEDITEQVNMDNLLRSERDKFHGMITAIGQGLHIINKDYEVEYQNEVLQEIFGARSGRKCYEVYRKRSSPCEKCLMQSVMETGEIQHAADITLNKRHYSQSYAPFQDVDGAMKCLVLLRDITDEIINQAKTMRTAQLATIGELAAGVAHEINNPINGILNYAQLIRDDDDDDDDGDGEIENSLLDRLVRESERVAVIVSKLLAYSRQRDDDIDVNKEETDIVAVLDDAFALYKHTYMKSGIKTKFAISADIPLLHIHPHQLQQVFINFLSNAGYALNERYEGHHEDKILEIRAELIYANDQDLVRVTFRDHGTGIPPEIRDQVTNPFFTTKASGIGTGLGLSITKNLIDGFHGTLRVESEEGSYTAMIVELPLLLPGEVA